MDKFINAIVEAIEPRLKGENLDTLDQFKELFPKVDLVEGDEVELTIRGDILLLKTGLTVGTIDCRNFTQAVSNKQYDNKYYAKKTHRTSNSFLLYYTLFHFQNFPTNLIIWFFFDYSCVSVYLCVYICIYIMLCLSGFAVCFEFPVQISCVKYTSERTLLVRR